LMLISPAHACDHRDPMLGLSTGYTAILQNREAPVSVTYDHVTGLLIHEL